MVRISRRDFLALSAMLGAFPAWAGSRPTPTRLPWHERRDRYPEGVASGDPPNDTVVLWTRYPARDVGDARLVLEVAEDSEFQRVVSISSATVSGASDWTCRILVGGLMPDRNYWYRFADVEGVGSRVGRTRTAPSDGDARPVRFSPAARM
jgi:alkaline phosphatase D